MSQPNISHQFRTTQAPSSKNQIPNESQISNSKVSGKHENEQRGRGIATPFGPLRFGIWSSIGIWFLAVGVSWPATGGAADATTLDERFRQVEKMSDLERKRLQRNLDEFKKLSPEQQAQYRDLHNKVEQSTNHLSSLLQEYSAWLTTLTPSQRDELNRATDNSQKLALIRQFKQAQEYRPETSSADVPEGPSADLPKVRQHMMGRGAILKGAELAAVMDAISTEVYGSVKKKPAGESTVKFYFDLLKKSIDLAPEGSQGSRSWPSTDLQKTLEKLPGLKEQLKGRPDGGRVALIRLIVGSLGNLAFEEFKPPMPNDQDRLDVFNKLPPETQAEINKLHPEDSRQRLNRMYFMQRNDKSPEKIQEVRSHIDQFLKELGMPPLQPPPFGGEGFRPGAGPGGPRRPQDGRPFGPDGGRPGDPPRGRNEPDRPRGRPND